jgi:hypothetical protein
MALISLSAMGQGLVRESYIDVKTLRMTPDHPPRGICDLRPSTSAADGHCRFPGWARPLADQRSLTLRPTR